MNSRGPRAPRSTARETIEGIAFACLAATKNGLKHVPRDAKGQWNAETILTSLKKKNIDTLPSPSIIRAATDEESKANNGVRIVVDGVPERRALARRADFYLPAHAPLAS